jgi:hypothetical protein
MAKKIGGRKISEASLNKKVIKWINSLPQGYAHKQKAGPANPGALDVSGSIEGIRIELEGKIGDNKPTPLQRQKISEWRKLLVITGCYWNLEEAKKLVTIGFMTTKPGYKRPWMSE